MFVLMRLEHVFSFGPLALHGRDILRYATFWAIATLLVGLFEEIVFRGYVQHTLSSALGFWPSALLISAVFGATHLFDRTYTWFGVVSAAIFGLLFSLTLRRTGALWLAISFHAAFDYSQIFLFSPSNGAVKTSAHLLRSSLQGPVWLTGGTVGPEDSANGLIVLVAVFFFFNWLHPRSNWKGLRDGLMGSGLATQKTEFFRSLLENKIPESSAKPETTCTGATLQLSVFTQLGSPRSAGTSHFVDPKSDVY